MTQAAQFANAEWFVRPTRRNSFSTAEKLHGFFDDMLLDDGFDQIGRLDHDGPEFDMYRELNALPRE